jgi:hypothetical protein
VLAVTSDRDNALQMVESTSNLIAEYALLAHSMPGIAGSAQINHSDVLPGGSASTCERVAGWGSAAVWLATATQPSASPHSELRDMAEAGIAVEAIASSGAALCERRLVADWVRWAV